MHTQNRPLVTFAVLFFNQADYVKDAVKGALSQDYQNLQIVFSDDCSTDNTYEILKECIESYKGPHQLVLNRNTKNLGIAFHCNLIYKNFFRGDYLIVAGGDDISMPTRVSESVDFFIAHPEIRSLTTYSEQVDINLSPLIDVESLPCLNQNSIFTLDDYCRFNDFVVLSGDSRAIRREVVEAFPPIEYSKEEDIEWFFRCLLLGPVAFLRTPLVKRRIHGENISKKPHDVKYRELQRKQLLADATLAFNSGIIDSQQYAKVNAKINSVIRKLINVDNSRRHPLIWRVMHAITHSIDSLTSWICKY